MAEIKIEDLYSKGGVPLQNQVQRNANDIASLKLDIRNTAGTPVLSTAWVQLRTSMWSGYVAADGQLLKRADYPDAWEAIEAGKVPVVSDADWLADPAKRGCFTLGDGSTTFRVPDYNGMQPGSYGPVYLGGGSAASGAILRDRIQNIAGSLRAAPNYGLITPSSATGAFYAGETLTGNLAGETGGADNDTANRRVANFDASRVARTGDTTRPITAVGCWAIKLFGAVQNAGSIDATGLATQVANLDSNKLDKANVVAPMANGGVIERGSNANGEYVKFADGTMICTSYYASSELVCDQGYTGLYGTPEFTITHPAPFSSTPRTVVGGFYRTHSFGAWPICILPSSTQVVGVVLCDMSGKPAGFDTQFISIGLWK